MSIFFKKIVDVVFIVMFIFILSIMFYFNMENFKEYYYPISKFMEKYIVKEFAFSVISFVFIFITISILINKISYIKTNYKMIIYVVTILLFVFQIVWIHSYYVVAGHDLTTVVNNSFSMAENNSFISTDLWYFSTYPNNHLIIVIFSTIMKITNWVGLYDYAYFIILIFINCLTAITSILVFKLGDMIFNDEVISIISYIYFVFLITLSPWNSIAYSDSLALIFSSLIFYLYVKVKENKLEKTKRIIYFILIGFLATISLSIKPQSFIMFISLILYELFIYKDTYINKLKKLALIVLSFIISMQVITFVTKDIRSQVNEEANIGYLHYIVMGLDEKMSGLYSHQDFKDSTNAKTIEERTNLNKEKIKTELSNYTLERYKNHVIKKTQINFNNGTFSWLWIADYHFSKIKKNTNSFLSKYSNEIYMKDGKYYEKYTIFQNIVWLTIVVLSFISILNTSKYKHLVYVTLIGVFLFVTIFEAMARYLYTNAPIFIVCAMYGVKYIKDKFLKKS